MDSLLAGLLDLTFTPLVVVHVAAMATAATLLYLVKTKFPRTQATRIYLLATAATFLWTLFEGAQAMSRTPREVWVWFVLESLGFGAAGPLWFLFVDRSVRRPWIRGLVDQITLWTIFVATVLVAVSDPFHHLTVSGIANGKLEPGPALWGILVVQLGLVFTAQVRLLVDGWTSRTRAVEVSLVLLGTLLPAAFLVASLAGAVPGNLTGPAGVVFAAAQLGILETRFPNLGTSLSLSVLLDTMDTAVASLLPDGTILETNRRLEELLPEAAARPTTLSDIYAALGIPPEERSRMDVAERATSKPIRTTCRDSRGRWLELSIHPVSRGSTLAGYLFQARDVSAIAEVTEQLRQRERELEQARAELEEANRRLEARARELEEAVAAKAKLLEEQHAQLLHAQKMESLGTLAGGIAHDFNNVLFSVIGYADLILQNPGDTEEVGYCAKKIRDGAQRATELTKKLLGFARRDKPKKQPLNLADLVRDVVSVLRRTVEPRIRFRYEIGSEPCLILGDPQQMHQVLMNLCLNAAEAISGMGQVTIRILGPEKGSGGELLYRLQVEDTGCGMTEDVRARIFEPFFTTKSRGKGTGLGLSLVYGIVQEHGGTIEVQSTPGKGSTFTVTLPALDESRRASVERPERRGSGKYRTARRTFDHLSFAHHRVGILVVDDNQEVLALTKRYFEEPLFQVWPAATGLEAEQILTEYPDAVDIILLDLVLPDAPAREVFQRLRKLAPDVPIVLMSGYHSDELVSELLNMGASHYLRKPFGRRDIRRVVRTILEE